MSFSLAQANQCLRAINSFERENTPKMAAFQQAAESDSVMRDCMTWLRRGGPDRSCGGGTDQWGEVSAAFPSLVMYGKLCNNETKCVCPGIGKIKRWMRSGGLNGVKSNLLKHHDQQSELLQDADPMLPHRTEEAEGGGWTVDSTNVFS